MMIWTIEAAPPWRVTAVDRDRNSAQNRDQDIDGRREPAFPDTASLDTGLLDRPILDRPFLDRPFLDAVVLDDRGGVAAALASVATHGAAECACRIAIGP